MASDAILNSLAKMGRSGYRTGTIEKDMKTKFYFKEIRRYMLYSLYENIFSLFLIDYTHIHIHTNTYIYMPQNR